MKSDHEQPLATIDRVTRELQMLQQRERDKALRGSYQAAIERLQALAYRLKEVERPVVLPEAPKPAPTPAPAVPAAVRKSIVVAMKPKRRV